MSFNFLPTNKTEMKQKGWSSIDVVIITGDAYVDHPSFCAAIIGRYLESQGFTVGIIAQPDWKRDEDFLSMGTPNLFFGITAGNLDSMIANYSPEKKHRRKDEYSEGGISGNRPDRAVIVYSNIVRKLFSDTPIVIGGIEASLRRLAYYDYWDNKIRRSILFDTRAEVLVYGMGEKAIAQIAKNIQNGDSLKGIKNTAYISDSLPADDHIILPSFEEVSEDKVKYSQSVKEYYTESVKKKPRTIVQMSQKKYVITETPGVINNDELNSVYMLPFTREAHPKYQKPIPAFSFVKHSVVSHRGCYGGCSFCTLNLHQGKYINSRSIESMLKEIKDIIIPQKDFKGYILDIGGPSANMYASKCEKDEGCIRVSCLVPNKCNNLKVDFQKQLQLLRQASSIKGIKKVFVNSGVRVDLALKCPEYMHELVANHVSGQLSIAPEHMSPSVLNAMNKPEFSIYEKFFSLFDKISSDVGKKQYIIPYFIASHPGSSLTDMYMLAMYLKKNKMRVEQVQNYTPIPMTLSSCMYYTGINPMTGKPVYVPKSEERLLQRALLQPQFEDNRVLVRKALKMLGKEKDYAYLTR